MIVIVGTVTADLLVQSDVPLSELGGDGFRNSNLVFTETPPTISMGGNGGNSAYVLAGLGAETALCGAVGQDLLGDMLLDRLTKRGVDSTGVTRCEEHATSTSTIVLSDAANQVVFHHLGSTAQARYEDMPRQLFDQADALLASSFPIMPQLRAGGFARALARVRAAGGTTAMDIGPAIGEPATLDEMESLFPSLDYLIANTHELAVLAQVADWQQAAERVLDAGARHLVIKQGEEGASVWSKTERFHVSGFDVEARISVGAGDSFNVGFLYALCAQQSLEDALRFGNAVAALVVAGQRGVLDSPSLTQVEAFLEEQFHREQQ